MLPRKRTHSDQTAGQRSLGRFRRTPRCRRAARCWAPFVLNGINGYVDNAMLGNGVMVTAQQNGVIVQTTAPNTTTGEFFLARLPAGTYDVVLTANERSTAVIAGVLVATSTSVVPVSNTVTRITMPVSL